jgi:hypothetical protein
MDTQARHRYAREHVISRHVEVVVEYRPEPSVGSDGEPVEPAVYQKTVEQNEYCHRNEREQPFLFSYLEYCFHLRKVVVSLFPSAGFMLSGSRFHTFSQPIMRFLTTDKTR